jgi:uncharacterized protein YdcH (DUF465 family)
MKKVIIAPRAQDEPEPKGNTRMAYNGNHPLNARMKQQPHVQHMLQEHEEIKERIRQERAHAWVREDVIRSLKMQQVELNDRIEAVRQRH